MCVHVRVRVRARVRVRVRVWGGTHWCARVRVCVTAGVSHKEFTCNSQPSITASSAVQ